MFQPFTDRVAVIVEKDKAVKKDAHGMHVPDVAREKPTIATVAAVGRGTVGPNGIVPLQCKRGDRIVFSKFAGKKQEIDGVEYLILHETEILGKITDEKNCEHMHTHVVTDQENVHYGRIMCDDCFTLLYNEPSN